MFIQCQSKSQCLRNSLQAGSRQFRHEVRQGGQRDKGRADRRDRVLCPAAAVASGRGSEVRRERGLGLDQPTRDLPTPASAPAPSQPCSPSNPCTLSAPPAPSAVPHVPARWPLRAQASVPFAMLFPAGRQGPALSFPSGHHSDVTFLVRLPWPPLPRCQHHPHTRARTHTSACTRTSLLYVSSWHSCYRTIHDIYLTCS